MRNETCPYESAVVVASRSGQWDATLLTHFTECARCADAARVAGWMRGIALQPDAANLPDPDRIWVQAQFLANQQAEERALRASTIAQILRYGPIAAGAVWLAFEWSRAEGSPLVPVGTAIAFAAFLLRKPVSDYVLPYFRKLTDVVIR